MSPIRLYSMKKVSFVIVGLLVASIVFSLIGCEELDVKKRSQLDEVEGLITDSELGQELFSTIYLPFSYSYTLLDGDTTFQESYLSNSRTISVNIPTDSLVMTQFGTYNYGAVMVTDNITVQLNKITTDTTISQNITRTVKRKGFLLKIGSNDQSYSGWKLFGYNSGDSLIYLNVEDTDGQVIKHGSDLRLRFLSNGVYQAFNYFPVDSITMIPDGSDLIVTGSPDTALWNIFSGHIAPGSILFAELNKSLSGTMTINDTLSTPANNQRFWSVIRIMVISPVRNQNGLPTIYNWFIPYKIEK